MDSHNSSLERTGYWANKHCKVVRSSLRVSRPTTQATAGFTLIELLVVIAIIGLLAAVVLAAVNTARAKGADARRLSDMHSLEEALELYANDNNGNYPPNPTTDAPSACGGSVPSCVDDLTGLVPQYIGSLPVDPSYGGTSANYRYVSANGGYTLLVYSTTLAPGIGWCRPQVPVSTGYTSWITTYPAC